MSSLCALCVKRFFSFLEVPKRWNSELISMNDVVLAVDLGGTNLRMAAVERDGNILANARTGSQKDWTPGDLVGELESLAAECGCAGGTDRRVVGFGVGVPANFNAEGVLTHVTNLPKLTGMNLKADISTKFGVPVILENDATAATIFGRA